MNRVKKSSLWTILLFTIPALIPMVMFWIIPMFLTIWISLTDWDYISPTYNFVALENYKNLFENSDFKQSVMNTLQFSVFTIIPTLVIGFFVALLLDEKLSGKKTFRGVIFTPYITPTVAIAIVWSYIFSPIGILNKILEFMGLEGQNWLTDSDTAMWSIIIFSVWSGVGWTMMFYYDAIQQIPKSLFEVADISGASFLKKIKDIYIPMVSPTSIYLIIILTINSIQAYDQINVMTQGGPSGSTRTMLYYYYQLAFEFFNMGEATAVAVLLLLISAVLAGISLWASKKYVYYR